MEDFDVTLTYKEYRHLLMVFTLMLHELDFKNSDLRDFYYIYEKGAIDLVDYLKTQRIPDDIKDRDIMTLNINKKIGMDICIFLEYAIKFLFDEYLTSDQEDVLLDLDEEGKFIYQIEKVVFYNEQKNGEGHN